jgi:hypoxanthine phosphoribosyltransferase
MAKYVLSDIIYTQDDIEKRAEEIAADINRDYAGETVVFIGILRGAVMWLAQLLKSIKLDAEVDFMDVSSYGAATKSSGIVKIEKDLDNAIDGKHVIVVEDIVDSGVTLNYLKEYLLAMNPKSLKICALLDKPTGRRADLEADYIGFTAGDVFIVGYGLDVNQKYRQLPYITSVIVEE